MTEANVHRTWPNLPIIFTSGHGDYPGLKRALATPMTSMLRKPYAFDSLVRELRSVTVC